MNKQSTQKLGLFLTGIEQRIKDNADFFTVINIDFKSGTKIYTAVIKLINNKLEINYNGITEKIEIDWLSLRVKKISDAYESLIFNYIERGSNIIIEADAKNVKMHTKELQKSEPIKSHNETSHIGNRNYFIKVGQADALLKELGIMGENGKIKNDMIRKYNQIDYYIELVNDILFDLTAKHESITIVDCGCGKSYLSFVLNYYIKEVLKKSCHFIGLDSTQIVIDASKKIAQNLGYNNMEFKIMHINDYVATREINMTISLHACDTATDEAIALGIRNNSDSIVMVPCCHRELLNQYDFPQLENILKYGILKSRFADTLTEGMRALLLEALGYKVSVVEYISPLETPKNIMIRAEKKQGNNKKLFENYNNLKNLFKIDPMLGKLILKE